MTPLHPIFSVADRLWEGNGPALESSRSRPWDTTIGVSQPDR